VKNRTRRKKTNGAKQKPIEGTSLVYSFDKADAPERHTTQYFELAGNRAGIVNLSEPEAEESRFF
jgi:arylsulfatase A-like enzyme